MTAADTCHSPSTHSAGTVRSRPQPRHLTASRRLAGWLVAAACTALLSGCATLSEEECKTADWGRLGHKDGAAGQPESRLAEHAEACAKVGIRPMADLWRAGWDRGVRTYCTPRMGWDEGMAGRSYHGVCRGRSGENDFLAAYRAGSEIHRLQSRIDSNQNEIRRLEKQLSKSRDDEERRKLRRRIRELDDEQSDLRSSLNSRRYGSRY